MENRNLSEKPETETAFLSCTLLHPPFSALFYIRGFVKRSASWMLVKSGKSLYFCLLENDDSSSLSSQKCHKGKRIFLYPESSRGKTAERKGPSSFFGSYARFDPASYASAVYTDDPEKAERLEKFIREDPVRFLAKLFPEKVEEMVRRGIHVSLSNLMRLDQEYYKKARKLLRILERIETGPLPPERIYAPDGAANKSTKENKHA